jgi:tRNA/rRNA methyltransferase
MAGTDKSRPPTPTVVEGGGPAIILVEPQLGENIGAAARAMLNCGLTDLRLVRPRDGWPNETARAAGAGADAVLDRARLYAKTAEAVADLRHLYAATARGRDMNKPVVNARRAGADMRRFAALGESCGVLFGPERSGLTNDDVALADTVLIMALNPAFRSLNLAHAVLVVGYEWFMAAESGPDRRLVKAGARLATKAELVNFFEHLESELDACGFLRVAEKRPSMVRNLRNMFQRARLMDHELKTLHGMVTGLSGRRRKGGPKV